MTEEYALVEAADNCPVQEDAEWQDDITEFDQDKERPLDVPLEDPRLDELTRLARSRDRWMRAKERLQAYFAKAMAFIDNKLRAWDFRMKQLAYNLTAALLQAEGAKRRYIDTPFGRFGFRRKPARLKIVDTQAVISAVDAEQLPRACLKMAVSVVKVELDKLYAATGEIPPGCIMEPETDEFYMQ